MTRINNIRRDYIRKKMSERVYNDASLPVANTIWMHIDRSFVSSLFYDGCAMCRDVINRSIFERFE